MYTGTLIDDLIATVERAEQRTREVRQPEERELWYATAHSAADVQPDLLGVA
jgi:hypothetical protein